MSEPELVGSIFLGGLGVAGLLIVLLGGLWLLGWIVSWIEAFKDEGSWVATGIIILAFVFPWGSFLCIIKGISFIVKALTKEN